MDGYANPQGLADFDPMRSPAYRITVAEFTLDFIRDKPPSDWDLIRERAEKMIAEAQAEITARG